MRYPFKTLAIAGMLLASAVLAPSWADSDILIRHNGNAVTPPAPPIVESGRTLLPVRTVFDLVGLKVDWNPETRTAIGFRGDYRIEIPVDGEAAIVNGEQTPLEVPARLSSDRVYVPLRFVSEALGADVDWDDKTRTINIYTNHLKTKVFFTDPTLKEAIYEAAGKNLSEDITQGDLIYLVNLDLSHKGLTTLGEIEYLENLKSLNLEGNEIRNLDPLAKLKRLEVLNVSDNQVESIQTLDPLRRLKEIDIRNNSIKNIQVISLWTNLKKISIAGNKLDTAEELSPLYYIRDHVECDLDLSDIEEPARNTWNLRSDIDPYRIKVADGLYWIPAVEMGPSWNENEDMDELIQNTPMGRAVKIKSLYDLLQYLQHDAFTLNSTEKQVKDPDSQRTWVYTKTAFDTLKSKKATPRALANAAAYLLAQDYRDSGVLVIIGKDGQETVRNYIQNVRTVKEEAEDEDDEDVTVTYTEYALFDARSYLKDSQNPAAPEDGVLDTYQRFGGIQSNIHLTEDPLDYVKAITEMKDVAVVYTISYFGNDKAVYPSSTYPEAVGTGSRVLVLPKSPVITDKDDEDYNSNPIETFYHVLYDDSSDKFTIRWDENHSQPPVWGENE